ncbi:TIGR00296 family protein [Candidatus Micrarchaeota archaeon]|nr:TIGR00296 family protein [Candidatus Micrarchaeota archaeon]MBU1939537.1 TIGR00296 family protein [Candidatus Micrarchaeota archaeon]
MAFTLEEGKLLVRAARKSIEYYMAGNSLSSEKSPRAGFEEERGVFVTLSTFPGHELRGCIGYIEPIKPLWKGVLECAVSAAFNDPRFPPMGAGELGKIVIEVSVLTVPELIEVGDAEEYVKKVKVGEDGLIVERGVRKGLLLPQVAPEWGWGEEEFLNQTCVKAGLSAAAWKEKGTKIYKFQAQIFREEEPKGKIVEGEREG